MLKAEAGKTVKVHYTGRRPLTTDHRQPATGHRLRQYLQNSGQWSVAGGRFLLSSPHSLLPGLALSA